MLKTTYGVCRVDKETGFSFVPARHCFFIRFLPDITVAQGRDDVSGVSMDQRKIALFDIDRTIYDGYLIFPLAEYFFKNGLVGRGVVNALSNDLRLYSSARVDYETTVENLNTHWAAGLRGRSPDLVLRLTRAFLETGGAGSFFPFAHPLMDLLRSTHDIYFVTGEVQCVGKAVADHFSAHGFISSEMEVKDSMFTGNIARSLAKKEGKRDAIEHLMRVYPYEWSLAFGDSDGDIELLAKVDHAFCINPTETLEAVAVSKGWHIVTPLSVLEVVKETLQRQTEAKTKTGRLNQ
ncbi:MAG: haloacid dehalogenase-like hydrolase [Syntrophorhabdus sp. PtaU1.Bin153]|nr:MAG: haloacid dehalogenase-like hydrolase [Syntrophorhabdus sp. PtaU1.Bin153]